MVCEHVGKCRTSCGCKHCWLRNLSVFRQLHCLDIAFVLRQFCVCLQPTYVVACIVVTCKAPQTGFASVWSSSLHAGSILLDCYSSQSPCPVPDVVCCASKQSSSVYNFERDPGAYSSFPRPRPPPLPFLVGCPFSDFPVACPPLPHSPSLAATPLMLGSLCVLAVRVTWWL